LIQNPSDAITPTVDHALIKMMMDAQTSQFPLSLEARLELFCTLPSDLRVEMFTMWILICAFHVLLQATVTSMMVVT
jgi:hypothetical protein